MKKPSFSSIRNKLDSYWIRACIGVTLIILAIILLSSIYLEDPKQNKAIQYIGKFNYSYRSFLVQELEINGTESGCIHRDCTFFCGNATKLNKDLTKAMEETLCSKIDVLEIHQQNFTILSKNWLKINSSITELILKNTNLISIENEAFNSESFTNTIILTIENSKLQNLTAGMLLGFTKVEYITIISEIKKINRIFFQPIKSSLHFLKMSQMTDSIRFDKIFGISNMTSLLHLDLSNNIFYTISGKIFNYIPKIHFLNLSNSRVQVISAGAFDHAKNLKILDLSHNNLKHIYDMKIVLHQTYLYLRDNPWNCSCDLEPLSRLYKNRKEMFMDISYCKYPQNYSGKIISRGPYDCEKLIENNQSTTLVSLTEFPVEITSESNHHELSTQINDDDSNNFPNSRKHFKLTCLNFFENSESTTERPNNNSDAVDTQLFQELTIVPPIYEFNITLISENSVLLKMSNDVVINDMEIIWYLSGKINNNDFHYECTNLNKNKTTLIENLKQNFSYVFCAIPTDQELISPFNCLPFYIPADNKTQTIIKLEEIWLSQDDKEATIAIVCLILTISLGFGGILIYLILKHYPNLLEGNKHVVVVKKSIDNCGKQFNISTVSNKTNKNNPLKLSVNSIKTMKQNVDTNHGDYEHPLEIEENDSYTLQHLDYLRKQFEKEKRLNSFPKRHSDSEHIYGTIKSPVARHTKRSV